MQEFAHGGDVFNLARAMDRAPDDFLDFSANINPLGPPQGLKKHLQAEMARIVHYPDPWARELVQAAAEAYGLAGEEIAAANGSTEVLYLLPRLCSLKRALIPVPAYVDYERVCRREGLQVERLPLGFEEGFAVDWSALQSELRHGPALVFLGQPNNPTGGVFQAERLRALAAEHPDSLFVVDEAFADFVPGLDRLLYRRPENVLVLLSLTKFYALPGLRLGLAAGSRELIRSLCEALPPWSVNYLAQSAGQRVLLDAAYARRSRDRVREWREGLREQLEDISGLRVYPSQANFLLCRLEGSDTGAPALASELAKRSILIRDCSNFAGLSDRYFRVAVRTPEENRYLVQGLRAALAGRSSFPGRGPSPSPARSHVRPQSHTPAIMLQGLTSNAGKSVLATALCRILLQDGYRVAPFKAQNMSLNSYVTQDGGEMGRAQVLQAQACRLEPDVLMNPILLKPSSDTGSQVILMGRPVGNMGVKTYHAYKEQAVIEAHRAYDRLAQSYEVLVLEGAGSPAEINLKKHDLTNMAMARYAGAQVLLAGDIDRGGVFASFIGTMALLEEWERDLVAGYVINRFRGDVSLLDPAMEYVSRKTGKPFFGTVPNISDLGLPEEDSVTFKAGWGRGASGKEDAPVRVACLDLPHISNFTDLDPLLIEPDVEVRIVNKLQDLETAPDVLIIPGSKNTLTDMQHLQSAGFGQGILRLAKQGTEVVGICGGFQMLGEKVADPYGIESEHESLPGLNLLPVITELGREKHLSQVNARHLHSNCELKGYEIHHGDTHRTEEDLRCHITSETGREIGFASSRSRVWGTYLHGLFDADGFRRWFIDSIRVRKGLKPVGEIQARYDLEDKLDRLADIVRRSLDMDLVYAGLEAQKRGW